ncbi:hypothetical protein ID866_11911 [Astraeus odoratus]|nr:hypothetical protein ID866_11911 [Astraeus odoratus]
MTYNFIDHAISKAKNPLPFTIPHTWFVEAGLALRYGQAAAAHILKAGSINTAYLVEEGIEDSKIVIIKFIHNGSCIPLPKHDSPGYDVAQFLAFTQHVQYFKTGGLMYISD